MSDTSSKYYDQIFYVGDEREPTKKFNNKLTPIQAKNILNRCILAIDNERLEKDIEILKEWIDSRI